MNQAGDNYLYFNVSVNVYCPEHCVESQLDPPPTVSQDGRNQTETDWGTGLALLASVAKLMANLSLW